MGLSLGVAMLINQMKKHKELFSLIFLVPLVIPSGSMVSFWKSLFAYDGALNGLLHTVGNIIWNAWMSISGIPIPKTRPLWKASPFLSRLCWSAISRLQQGMR